MPSLLNSFGILCPAYGPVAGSEKQPKDAKPRIAETVELVTMLLVVIVGSDDVGSVEVCERDVFDEDGGGVDEVGNCDGEDETELDVLEPLDDRLDEDDEIDELELLVLRVPDLELDTASTLLYMDSRDEPPHYSIISTCSREWPVEDLHIRASYPYRLDYMSWLSRYSGRYHP